MIGSDLYYTPRAALLITVALLDCGWHAKSGARHERTALGDDLLEIIMDSNLKLRPLTGNLWVTAQIHHTMGGAISIMKAINIMGAKRP